MNTLKDLPPFLEKQWYSPIGLITAELASFGITIPYFISHLSILASLSLSCLFGLLILAFWWFCQQPPKTREDKIGFLVAISCPDEEEKKKIQEDFIDPLHKLIKSGVTGNTFEFLIAKEHISSKIHNIEEAEAIRKKARAHFMIYGVVRLRKINGVDTHVIELEGLVSHNSLSKQVSESISREFGELLPRRVQATTENDVFSLHFTSEWTDVVSQYIIATAAGVSGDYDYAESLYLTAKQKLHGMDTKFPIYTVLKQRIPLKISEIYMVRSQILFERWKTNKEDLNPLQEIESYMQFLAPEHDSLEGMLNLNAIIKFCLHRDTNASISFLNRIPKSNRKQNWHLNMAFLLGYMGKLNNAARHYRLASTELSDMFSLNQIEDFIEWAISENPQLPQLHYCLGYFNWKVKGDDEMAKLDFARFIQNPVVAKKFPKEQEISKKFIESA